MRLRGGAARACAAPRSDPSVTRPPMSDWAWRPPVWTRPLEGPQGAVAPGGQALAPGCTLFHDDTAGAVSAHQRPTPDGPARFALDLTLGAFAGSYLSLALDLQTDAATTLTRGHILRIDVTADADGPLYARLNLRHGPDADALTDRLRPEGEGVRAELDLGFTPLAASGVKAAWIDLSLSPVANTTLVLADVTLLRRPRAGL